MAPRTRSLFARPLLLTALAGGLLATALPACSSSDEATGEADGELGHRVGSSVVSTSESALSLFDGYNPLLDQRTANCVTAADPGNPFAISVGNVEEKFVMRYVSSKTELADDLGIDLSLGLKVPKAKLGASFEMLKSYRKSTTQVSFLLKATQSYSVTNNRRIVMDETNSRLLANDPGDFLHRCGPAFVNGVRFQASVVALIQFETTSEETANDIKASITGGGSYGVVSVDASAKTKLSNASKKNDVQASIAVQTNGFLISGEAPPPTIRLENGLDETVFKRIDELRAAMSTSLRRDMCHDTGSGKCDDGPSPGYNKNVLRHARPYQAILLNYSNAVNAPKAVPGKNIYLNMEDTLSKSESFVRALTTIQFQMENAYNDEITKFLNESQNTQYRYNVAPPATAKLRTEEVAALSNEWAKKFRPDNGIEMGTEVAPLQEAIDRCLAGATSGDYSPCHVNDAPDGLAEYKRGVNSVQEYMKKGRVVRLRVYSPTDPSAMTISAAKKACDNVGGFKDRLPTRAEVARLGPSISTSMGGPNGEVWFTDETGICKGDPYYSNPITNTAGVNAGYMCDESMIFSKRAFVICVPQSGPVGTLLDL